MASKFGGVAVEEEPKSKFGGVPVEEPSGTAEHLKDEGFLKSAWNSLAAPISAVKEMLTPHTRAERMAQVDKAVETAGNMINGTPEQKAAARDEMVAAIPLGSTYIKAREGNYAGAAGDVAGMAALGGVAKAVASPAVGAATKGFASGAAESLANAPKSPIAKGIGRVSGLVAGHKLIGGFEGGLAGGYVGGEIAGKLAAVPSAVRAGVARAKASINPQPLPPGFGITSGSTVGPNTPTAQLVNQPIRQFAPPPAGGTFPGTEVSGMIPPEPVPTVPGFGVSSGSTASPIVGATPPVPGYQPPVSGALPSALPEATPVGASMPVEAPVNPAVAEFGGLSAERASTPVGPSPEILDQIARSQAGKRFNQLFPQEQQIVRRIAERMSQPTAAMADQPAQSLATPEAAPVPPQAPSTPTPGNSAEIAAALRDEMVRSGTIAPEAAQPVGGAPEPTALADLMRDLPQPTKKAVAHANYRAVKEGAASPETAGPTYEAAGRATKVDPVVKAILDHGFTYSDIIRLTKTQIKDLANKLSKATAAEGGQHPGHAFSPLSVDEMIGQLRMAEDAAKRAGKPASK